MNKRIFAYSPVCGCGCPERVDDAAMAGGLLALAALAVLVVIGVIVAVTIDRMVDRSVASSYVLVQKALARKGKGGFLIVLIAAIVLAVALTLLGIAANI